MNFGNMGRGDGGSPDIKIGPIRIAPCMKFHSPFMRFFDHELKRIIIWRRGLALYYP